MRFDVEILGLHRRPTLDDRTANRSIHCRQGYKALTDSNRQRSYVVKFDPIRNTPVAARRDCHYSDRPCQSMAIQSFGMNTYRTDSNLCPEMAAKMIDRKCDTDSHLRLLVGRRTENRFVREV